MRAKSHARFDQSLEESLQLPIYTSLARLPQLYKPVGESSTRLHGDGSPGRCPELYQR